MRSSQALVVTVALTVGLAAPSGADVLVLRDGSRVATEGPWEVKGSVVVFALDGGTLASLRLREVDLDASAAATAEAAAPPVEAPPPREPPRAVLTLTDDDVARAPDSVLMGTAVGEEIQEGSSPSPSTTPRGREIHVTVDSFEESYSSEDGGVRVSGVLRNNSAGPATSLAVTVEVYGDEGTKLAESPARVGTTALAGGATVGFVAVFPGIDIVRDVKFRIRHNSIVFGAPPANPEPSATVERAPE